VLSFLKEKTAFFEISKTQAEKIIIPSKAQNAYVSDSVVKKQGAYFPEWKHTPFTNPHQYLNKLLVF